MFGHVAVENPSPVMRNDEVAVQHAEGQRRHGKEIHRGDGFTMVTQERSEISMPSIFSSPCIRGAPQVAFSATMRKMSSRNSLLTHFRPAWTRCRESQVQYSLNLVDASEQQSPAGQESTPASILAKTAATSPRTIVRGLKILAADADAARQPVVAEEPDFPAISRSVSERSRSARSTEASAGDA